MCMHCNAQAKGGGGVGRSGGETERCRGQQVTDVLPATLCQEAVKSLCLNFILTLKEMIMSLYFSCTL